MADAFRSLLAILAALVRSLFVPRGRRILTRHEPAPPPTREPGYRDLAPPAEGITWHLIVWDGISFERGHPTSHPCPICRAEVLVEVGELPAPEPVAEHVEALPEVERANVYPRALASMLRGDRRG